jgi:hypothetical protein
MDPTRKKLMVVLLVLAAAGLLVLGPEWPARASELTCDDGTVRGPYVDIDACVAAIDDGCRSCSTRERWFAPFVYMLLVPGLLVAAVTVAGKAVARGVVAVWIVLTVVFMIPVGALFYPPGVRMPLFIQNAVIVWPQLVFFGPTLFPGSLGSYAATIGFWFLAAVGFGWLTARLKVRWLLLPIAAGFVIVVVLLVRVTAPLVGLHQSLEFP